MGIYTINISTTEQLALSLKQKTPAVLLGNKKLNGIVAYNGTDQMAYYAWPNMTVTGVRGVGSKQMPLQGRAWMEHQWGDMALGDYRWKYLAIDLVLMSTGRPSSMRAQLLLFKAEKDGKTSPDVKKCGVWVEADGHYSLLDADSLTITSEPKWPLKDKYAEISPRHPDHDRHTPSDAHDACEAGGGTYDWGRAACRGRGV